MISEAHLWGAYAIPLVLYVVHCVLFVVHRNYQKIIKMSNPYFGANVYYVPGLCLLGVGASPVLVIVA